MAHQHAACSVFLSLVAGPLYRPSQQKLGHTLGTEIIYFVVYQLFVFLKTKDEYYIISSLEQTNIFISLLPYRKFINISLLSTFFLNLFFCLTFSCFCRWNGWLTYPHLLYSKYFFQHNLGHILCSEIISFLGSLFLLTKSVYLNFWHRMHSLEHYW